MTQQHTYEKHYDIQNTNDSTARTIPTLLECTQALMCNEPAVDSCRYISSKAVINLHTYVGNIFSKKAVSTAKSGYKQVWNAL